MTKITRITYYRFTYIQERIHNFMYEKCIAFGACVMIHNKKPVFFKKNIRYFFEGEKNNIA